MNQNTPSHFEERITPRLYASYVLVGGLGAAFTLTQTPFNVLYLLLVTGCGVLAFSLDWWGIIHNKHLGYISTIVAVFTQIEGKRIFPKNILKTHYLMLSLQFLFVYVFVFGGMWLVFRHRLRTR